MISNSAPEYHWSENCGRETEERAKRAKSNKFSEVESESDSDSGFVIRYMSAFANSYQMPILIANHDAFGYSLRQKLIKKPLTKFSIYLGT